ncbi:FkbM family methyltransferase [Phenylobacterium sp. J367]|uniref:FkbM family methyltransferase n=1 Tax=Phenylobacterium sp. J367 TaxID=2898435 RepID=UPI0021507B7B|nr:FkbM family methyltransferase [Phenylobacterium sp. J367]MCR5878897.1 FkbM family methyltransferase [Phenylobacterium sp. J367]
MSDDEKTLLAAVEAAIRKRPELAKRIEEIGALAQGKGWGTATIAQEINCVQAVLKGPLTLAVDVGGNIGDYTATLRARYPDLEIHTFEPAQRNVARLRTRFAEDPGVRIVPLALSDKGTSTTLYSNVPGSGGASLTRRNLDHLNIRFDLEEKIVTTRFDDYWQAALQGRPIDLVKLDIEGHELDALNGFGDALAVTRVVQFEFGGCNIDTRTYFRDFWYFFTERGFTLFRITPFGAWRIRTYREAEENYVTTNFLAVRDPPG